MAELDIYKHYKGKYYELLIVAKDHDKVDHAVYRSCETQEIWVRPLSEFETKFTYVPLVILDLAWAYTCPVCATRNFGDHVEHVPLTQEEKAVLDKENI